MLPDWSAVPTAVPYAVFTNPQSLNLYTYVGNNPVNAIDADGHEFSSNSKPYGIGSGRWIGEQLCKDLDTTSSSGCLDLGVGAVDDGGGPPLANILERQALQELLAAQQQSYFGVRRTGSDTQPGDPIYPGVVQQVTAHGGDGGCKMSDLVCRMYYEQLRRWLAAKKRQPNTQNNGMKYDIFHCPSCVNTWVQSNTVVTDATIATTAAVAAVPLAGEIGASAAGDALFARGTGLLNSNNIFRVGWGWYGANVIDNLVKGGDVFRVVVGCPSCFIHWHIWP